MRVLVTSVTHNSGLAIVRGLSRKGWEIVGADQRRLPLNACSRHVKRFYLLPEGPTEALFVEAVIEVLKKEKPEVFLPVSGVKEASKYRKEIEKYTRLLVPPYESWMTANDNQRTLEECRKSGIPTPGVFDEKRAIEVLNRNPSRKNPVRLVIKPREDKGGAQGLGFVEDAASLRKVKQRTESLYGKTIIEEYIPGNTGCMRTVNLLFDKKHRLAAYFTTKKIRQWPNTGGISALSLSTNEWSLVEAVLPFFRKWLWQGPVEVELKIDERDGLPKVIEINPRFWGYIGFPIKCGVNFPVMACELALEKGDPHHGYPGYTLGLKYIDPSAYAKAALAELASSEKKLKTFGKILQEVKGKKVTNNFELKDFTVNVAKMCYEIGLTGISNARKGRLSKPDRLK